MIVIKKTWGFSKESLQKLDQVVILANKVFAYDQFKSYIEAIPKFSNTTDNGIEVYQKIMRCDQSLVLGLYIPPWYKRWSSAIARENPDGSIEFKRSYFDSADLNELAGTIIHEVCHKAGYLHSFWNTKERPESVPYTVGTLAENLASLILVKESANGQNC